MNYAQESQLQDFSKAIVQTADKYPEFSVAQVISHAWDMTKRVYFRLTPKDKVQFLGKLNVSQLINK